MISIRKYLNEARSNGVAGVEADSRFSADLYGLSCTILDRINEFVLAGDASEALRSQLLEVKETLRPDLAPDQAALAADSVSSVLAAHRTSAQQASAEQFAQAQHVFSMLNQALVVLAEGNNRGISRLSEIQESLKQTAQIRDMASLKSSLAETVQFIQKESAKARETSAQELGRFESEVSSVREFFSTRLELAGRPEGVTRISDSLKTLVPGEALYLVAYLCDRLSAVTQRYGPGVAEELLSLLIKERLKPVAPANTLYRWTPCSLVAVFNAPRDTEKLRREVADLNRTPLVHKMALGGRTAVLTVSPSHLVAEGISDSPEVLIEQVDRFTQVRV